LPEPEVLVSPRNRIEFLIHDLFDELAHERACVFRPAVAFIHPKGNAIVL
jgi:hypothetical protein